jgi:hypothetical protein
MLKQKPLKQRRRFIIAVIIIGLFGLGWLLIASAATQTSSIEPEYGIKNGVTAPGGDLTASGSNYVQFGNTSKSVEYSTYVNTIGPLASELNVASNGSWTWPTDTRATGGDQYKLTMRVPSNPTGGNYFWSSSFEWSNAPGSGGYIGMQTRVWPVAGGPRGAIFSIWNTTTAEAVSGGVAQPFGGEGTGMQTAIGYPWVAGRNYDLTIERDNSRSTSTYNWWRGYITDLSTNVQTEIGRIRTPTTWGLLYPNNTFLERYGLSNTCGSFETVSGVFTSYRLRQTTGVRTPTQVAVELRDYTDCRNVVTASGVNSGYQVTINPGTK